MANARSARVGRVRIAGATRLAPRERLCHARHRSTMARLSSLYECCGEAVLRRGRNGRFRAFGRHRKWGRSLVAALLFLCSGAAAHPPDAEFADWFRSLKEPGTEGTAGSGVSCCSPSSDCQITDYETDA